MRKLLLTVSAFLLLAGQALAQRVVTGKVTDNQGKPLENVSVLVKGTKVGTVTKADGTYSITVPKDGKKLVFSSVELIEQELAIESSNVSLVMADKTNDLDEVVVVAYGTVKKSQYVGSAAQINSKDFEKRPLMNVSNALVGAAPGIQTSTPGGAPGSSPGIRLRGFGSLNANSSPLYVVDGIVYDAGLANINPDDVESISVLKDASSAALYGSRAGNGVILITTKRGRAGTNTLSFKTNQGITSRGMKEYDRLGPNEWYPLMWQSYKNNLIYASGTNAVPADIAAKLASGLMPRNGAGLQTYSGRTFSDITQLLGYNPYNVASTSLIDSTGRLNPSASLLYAEDLDWQKAFMGTGRKEDYSLAYSGGSNKSDYTGSFGYNNEEGFAVKSYFKRFVGRLGVNTNPVKWFKTGLNIAGTYALSSNAAESGIVNPFSFSRGLGPIYPVYIHDKVTGAYVLDENGERKWDPGDNGANGNRPVNAGRHALQENQLNEDTYKRTYLSGRAYADLIIFPFLTATTKIGADFQESLASTYQNKIIGDGAPSGRSSRTNNRSISYTFTQMLNYHQKFGDHNVALLAGHENYDFTYNYMYAMRQDQIFDGNTEFTNFATTSSISSRTDRYRIESYFGRLNYDFQGKYLLEASIRRDGNSRFYKDVRWDNFWSAGVAWRLDQEKFMRSVAFVDQLKLRYSTGRVGNDQGIGYYVWPALYAIGINNGPEPGSVQSSLPSYDVTWEGSTSNDIGVDFSLFSNRLSGTVEYYNRVTDRLLLDVDQPLSNGGITSGPLSISKNVAEMYNRGLEVSLTGQIIRKKNFNYRITVNATTIKNQITKMDDVLTEYITSPNKWMAGHSRYEYYLRHFYGVDPTDGMALYGSPIAYNAANCRVIDNGKGSVDTVTTLLSNAQQMYTGKSSVPDVYGSIINSLSYKNFELNFVFVYQLGGYSYDGEYQGLMHAGTYGYALHKDALNAWTPTNTVTDVPRLESNNNPNFGGTSDRWLTKASYLNLNNITLAYNFSGSLLSKISAKTARIYLSGENLFWLTSRTGMNPANAFNGTQSNGYPPVRIISAGLSIGF